LSGDILQVNRLIYSEAARFPELGEAAWRRSRIGVRQVADLIEEYSAKEGVACREPLAAAEVYIMMLRGWYHDVLLKNRPVSDADLTATIDRFLKVLLAGRSGW